MHRAQSAAWRSTDVDNLLLLRHLTFLADLVSSFVVRLSLSFYTLNDLYYISHPIDASHYDLPTSPSSYAVRY